MPFQRAIAVLLLVTCGLPLAIGPHWHNHHHAVCSECHSGHAGVSSEGDRGGCPGHSCSGESVERDAHTAAAPDVGTLDVSGAGLDAEDCLACQFYSSHVALSQTAPAQLWAFACVVYEDPRGELARVEPHVYLARGPPVLVA